MILNNNIKSHFEQSSSIYEKFAAAQKFSAKNLAYMLLDINDISTILDVGIGTGIMVKELSQKFPNAKYTGIDISKEMLNKAKLNCEKINLTLINDNAENFLFHDKFDLITSNMCLHWFNDIESFISKTANNCKVFAFAIPILGSFENFYNQFPEKNVLDLPKLENIINLCQNLKNCSFKYEVSYFAEKYENLREAARYFKNIGANIQFGTKNFKNFSIFKTSTDIILIQYKILSLVILNNNY